MQGIESLTEGKISIFSAKGPKVLGRRYAEAPQGGLKYLIRRRYGVGTKDDLTRGNSPYSQES